MRTFVITVLLCLASTATAGSITGTVLQLDGTPIAALDNFNVVAQVGGVNIANGALTSTSAPFTYSIDINEADLNPQDVRVTLIFNATGRQTVIITGIAGNTNHDISIVMPEASKNCCHMRKCRLHRYRHRCRQ
jgi:hypothetical protein